MTTRAQDGLLTSADALAYELRGALYKYGLGSNSSSLIREFTQSAFKLPDLAMSFDYVDIWEDIVGRSKTTDKWTKLRTFLKMSDAVSKLGTPSPQNLFPAQLEYNLLEAAREMTLDQTQPAHDLKLAHKFHSKFSKSDQTKFMTASILQKFAEQIIATPSIADDETVELAKAYIGELKANGFYKGVGTQATVDIKKDLN